MKKILLITTLLFLISVNSQAKVGKGDLTFTPEILEYFIKYLRDPGSTSFVISEDGKFAMYGICGESGYGCQGGPGHTGTMMKNCKSVYGQRCSIFAQTKKFTQAKDKQLRTKKIRWNKLDYVFRPGYLYGVVDSDGKKNFSDIIAEGCNSKFECYGISKDYTDDEINKILIELGFLKKDTPKTRIVLNDNPSDSITKKIQKLFDLYKSGALSEDEFKIAKKMLLFSEE